MAAPQGDVVADTIESALQIDTQPDAVVEASNGLQNCSSHEDKHESSKFRAATVNHGIVNIPSLSEDKAEELAKALYHQKPLVHGEFEDDKFTEPQAILTKLPVSEIENLTEAAKTTDNDSSRDVDTLDSTDDILAEAADDVQHEEVVPVEGLEGKLHQQADISSAIESVGETPDLASANAQSPDVPSVETHGIGETSDKVAAPASIDHSQEVAPVIEGVAQTAPETIISAFGKIASAEKEADTAVPKIEEPVIFSVEKSSPEQEGKSISSDPTPEESTLDDSSAIKLKENTEVEGLAEGESITAIRDESTVVEDAEVPSQSSLDAQVVAQEPSPVTVSPPSTDEKLTPESKIINDSLGDDVFIFHKTPPSTEVALEASSNALAETEQASIATLEPNTNDTSIEANPAMNQDMSSITEGEDKPQIGSEFDESPTTISTELEEASAPTGDQQNDISNLSQHASSIAEQPIVDKALTEVEDVDETVESETAPTVSIISEPVTGAEASGQADEDVPQNIEATSASPTSGNSTSEQGVLAAAETPDAVFGTIQTSDEETATEVAQEVKDESPVIDKEDAPDVARDISDEQPPIVDKVPTEVEDVEKTSKFTVPEFEERAAPDAPTYDILESEAAPAASIISEPIFANASTSELDTRAEASGQADEDTPPNTEATPASFTSGDSTSGQGVLATAESLEPNSGTIQTSDEETAIEMAKEVKAEASAVEKEYVPTVTPDISDEQPIVDKALTEVEDVDATAKTAAPVIPEFEEPAAADASTCDILESEAAPAVSVISEPVFANASISELDTWAESSGQAVEGTPPNTEAAPAKFTSGDSTSEQGVLATAETLERVSGTIQTSHEETATEVAKEVKDEESTFEKEDVPIVAPGISELEQPAAVATLTSEETAVPTAGSDEERSIDESLAAKQDHTIEVPVEVQRETVVAETEGASAEPVTNVQEENLVPIEASVVTETSQSSETSAHYSEGAEIYAKNIPDAEITESAPIGTVDQEAFAGCAADLEEEAPTQQGPEVIEPLIIQGSTVSVQDEFQVEAAPVPAPVISEPEPTSLLNMSTIEHESGVTEQNIATDPIIDVQEENAVEPEIKQATVAGPDIQGEADAETERGSVPAISESVEPVLHDASTVDQEPETTTVSTEAISKRQETPVLESDSEPVKGSEPHSAHTTDTDAEPTAIVSPTSEQEIAAETENIDSQRQTIPNAPTLPIITVEAELSVTTELTASEERQEVNADLEAESQGIATKKIENTVSSLNHEEGNAENSTDVAATPSEQSRPPSRAELKRPNSPWRTSFQVTTVGRGTSPSIDGLDAEKDVEHSPSHDSSELPPRPWTPSYSVHSQGTVELANSEDIKDDETKPAPTDLETEEYSNRPASLEVVAAGQLDQVEALAQAAEAHDITSAESDIAQPDFTVVVTDTDLKMDAPVTDVHDQLTASATESAEIAPSAEDLPQAETSENIKDAPIATEVAALTAVPAIVLSSFSADTVEGLPEVPIIAVNDSPVPTEPVDQAQEAPKSPWTPSYSVTRQGPGSPAEEAELDLNEPLPARAVDAVVDTSAVAIPQEPEVMVHDVGALKSETPIVSESASKDSPKTTENTSVPTEDLAIENLGDKTINKDIFQPLGTFSDAPQIPNEDVSSAHPESPSDVVENDLPSARKRHESTTSSRFFPGSWFSSSHKTGHERTSTEIVQGEFAPVKATSPVTDESNPSAEAVRDDKEHKKWWCILM